MKDKGTSMLSGNNIFFMNKIIKVAEEQAKMLIFGFKEKKFIIVKRRKNKSDLLILFSHLG